jgi:hypothetical protein
MLVTKAESRVLEDVTEAASDQIQPTALRVKPGTIPSQQSKFEDKKPPSSSPSPWNDGQPPPKRLPEDLPSTTDLSVVLCRLRDELPAFFNGHHSFNMYSDQLLFQCNLLPTQIDFNSLQKYKFVLRNFKLMCVLVTSRPRLELMKITKHVDEGRIRARWRVMGVSRFFPFRGERSLIDGFSTFDVNCDGLISRHQVDKVSVVVFFATSEPCIEFPTVCTGDAF